MLRMKKHLTPIARKLIAFTTPRSHISEQYRTLRTNINFSSPDCDIQTMVVTSASHSEGKSTTSANLAVVFAQEGKRVLLIDGDMRKPTMHHTFSIKNNKGLSSVLARQISLKEAIRATKVENLDLLTCGPIPPNPAEMVGSKSMDFLMKQVKEIYNIIIIDAPPILAVADSQILANKCEGSILVIDSGRTEKAQALKAIEVITASNSRLIGAVLNNFKLQKNKNSYEYYGYERDENEQV